MVVGGGVGDFLGDGGDGGGVGGDCDFLGDDGDGGDGGIGVGGRKGISFLLTFFPFKSNKTFLSVVCMF